MRTGTEDGDPVATDSAAKDENGREVEPRLAGTAGVSAADHVESGSGVPGGHGGPPETQGHGGEAGQPETEQSGDETAMNNEMNSIANPSSPTTMAGRISTSNGSRYPRKESGITESVRTFFWEVLTGETPEEFEAQAALNRYRASLVRDEKGREMLENEEQLKELLGSAQGTGVEEDVPESTGNEGGESAGDRGRTPKDGVDPEVELLWESETTENNHKSIITLANEPAENGDLGGAFDEDSPEKVGDGDGDSAEVDQEAGNYDAYRMNSPVASHTDLNEVSSEQTRQDSGVDDKRPGSARRKTSDATVAIAAMELAGKSRDMEDRERLIKELLEGADANAKNVNLQGTQYDVEDNYTQDKGSMTPLSATSIDQEFVVDDLNGSGEDTDDANRASGDNEANWSKRSMSSIISGKRGNVNGHRSVVPLGLQEAFHKSPTSGAPPLMSPDCISRTMGDTDQDRAERMIAQMNRDRANSMREHGRFAAASDSTQMAILQHGHELVKGLSSDMSKGGEGTVTRPPFDHHNETRNNYIDKTVSTSTSTSTSKENRELQIKETVHHDVGTGGFQEQSDHTQGHSINSKRPQTNTHENGIEYHNSGSHSTLDHRVELETSVDQIASKHFSDKEISDINSSQDGRQIQSPTTRHNNQQEETEEPTSPMSRIGSFVKGALFSKGGNSNSNNGSKSNSSHNLSDDTSQSQSKAHATSEADTGNNGRGGSAKNSSSTQANDIAHLHAMVNNGKSATFPLVNTNGGTKVQSNSGNFVSIFDYLPLPKIKFTGRPTDSHPILKPSAAEAIRNYLPNIIKECSTWNLQYSLDTHGSSLNTLYHQCSERGPVLLLVEDEMGAVWGAFANEGLHVESGFYGTGSCFLFKINPPYLPLPPSAVSNDQEENVDSTNIKNGEPIPEFFTSTNLNTYYILCEKHMLAFGSGWGRFGLWINADFTSGTWDVCETFSVYEDTTPSAKSPISQTSGDGRILSPVSSSGPRIISKPNENENTAHTFSIMGLEVWSFEV